MAQRKFFSLVLLACIFFSCFGTEKASAIQAGDALPEIILPRLDGKYISVSSYRGNIIILYFWATWCPSCKKELPVFNSVLRNYRKVAIFGITSEGPSSVRDFMRSNRIPYDVLLDKDSSVFKRFGVISIPATIIIDRAGIIKKKYPGEVNYSELKQVLDSIPK